MTRKDIEWLKKEIGTEMIQLEPNRKERWSDVKYQTLRSVAQKIDQLDEPEVTLDKAFEKISELYPMTKEEIWRHLEQISAYGGRVTYGESEVLSQEWISEHSNGASRSQYVWVDDLQNLIVPKQEITEEQVMDWLDKNDFYDHITAETVLERAVDKGELSYYGTKYSVIEKPTIPQFVADYIEEMEGTSWGNITDLFGQAEGTLGDWWQSHDNFEKLAKAWLFGYEVEEEPLYYALIKGHELVNDEVEWATKYWNLWVSEGCVFPANRLEDYGDFLSTMSKEEWYELGINDTNADFVKVEEIEE